MVHGGKTAESSVVTILELKRLIVSNLYEWFIFDAAQFERLFVERLTGKMTTYFYDNISELVVAEVDGDLKFVYLHLGDYEPILQDLYYCHDS